MGRGGGGWKRERGTKLPLTLSSICEFFSISNFDFNICFYFYFLKHGDIFLPLLSARQVFPHCLVPLLSFFLSSFLVSLPIRQVGMLQIVSRLILVPISECKGEDEEKRGMRKCADEGECDLGLVIGLGVKEGREGGLVRGGSVGRYPGRG